MEIKQKMNPRFARLEGGLFSTVTKADVGSAYNDLQAQGVSLMGWADPFYPDPSIPQHLMDAAIAHLRNGFPSHYTMPIGSTELKKEIAKSWSGKMRFMSTRSAISSSPPAPIPACSTP